MIAKRLQIKNVSVKFGGLSALDDVSFEVDDNQLLGFIGPNGAGKTTLMRVIMGMVNPLSGNLLLNGRNIKPYISPAHTCGCCSWTTDC